MWSSWKKYVTMDVIWAFKGPNQAKRLSLFLLSVNLDIKFWATSPLPYLPTCHYTSHHDNKGLNIRTVSQTQLKVFHYKSWHGHGMVYLHSNRTSTRTFIMMFFPQWTHFVITFCLFVRLFSVWRCLCKDVCMWMAVPMRWGVGSSQNWRHRGLLITLHGFWEPNSGLP